MPKLFWTEEKIELLKKYDAAGMSSGEIADAMGIKNRESITTAKHRFKATKTPPALPPIKWTREIALEWREMMKVHKSFKIVAQLYRQKDPEKYKTLTPYTISRKLEEYGI